MPPKVRMGGNLKCPPTLKSNMASNHNKRCLPLIMKVRSWILESLLTQVKHVPVAKLEYEPFQMLYELLELLTLDRNIRRLKCTLHLAQKHGGKMSFDKKQTAL